MGNDCSQRAIHIISSFTHRADGDELVGVVHHGNEEVEKHDNVDDGEGAKHDEAPEPRELLDPGQLKVVEIYQAEGRPEQSLTGFPQAGGGNEPSVSSVSNNLSPLQPIRLQHIYHGKHKL